LNRKRSENGPALDFYETPSSVILRKLADRWYHFSCICAVSYVDLNPFESYFV